MTCSPARLAANRANAQKSTGPKTDEGKAKSRANALKHGLCSSILVPEDQESFDARVHDWFWAIKPQNEYDSWLLDQMATFSMRIDRAERMERRLRDRRALIAEVAWDDDRRLEVEILGGKIGSKPAEVVEALRKTPVGCDWLISRWSLLARAADLTKGDWTEAQKALAFNLLGTPFEFRQGREPGEILDEEGRVITPEEGYAAVARREIASLQERREIVADLDEVDRALTRVDLFDESNPELKRLRRYEGSLHNKLRWAISELRYESPNLKAAPELVLRNITKAPDLTTPEEALPEAQPAKPKVVVHEHPPFDIELSELPKDGSNPDLFKILLNRQEKREKKAEERREARREKAQRMRQ